MMSLAVEHGIEKVLETTSLKMIKNPTTRLQPLRNQCEVYNSFQKGCSSVILKYFNIKGGNKNHNQPLLFFLLLTI